MLLSIGEIVDKLVIENIKLAMVKQELRTATEAQAEKLYTKMMTLNKNRGILVQELDRKIEAVAAGAKNQVMETVKTYDTADG